MALYNTPMLGACNVDASAEPLLAGLLKKYTVLSHTCGNTTYKVCTLPSIALHPPVFVDASSVLSAAANHTLASANHQTTARPGGSLQHA
jgi:hypothetical protein